MERVSTGNVLGIQSGTCQFRKEGSELLEIDSVQTARAPTFTLGRRGRSLITASAVAGISYATAWVVGLAVWPSNLDVAASNLKVLAAYRAHRGAAVTQYALVEGLAAIALAVVVAALGQAARRRGAHRLGVAAVAAGLAAVAVSLVECVLGLLLAGPVAPDGDAVLVSGPLLLVWVTGVGVALAWTSRSGAAA